MTGAGTTINGAGLPAAPLRILVVSHYFWPEEFRVNELARDMRDRGHQVTVLTGYPNYPGHRIFPAYRTASRDYDVYDSDISVERFPIIGRGSSSLGLLLNYLSLALTMSLMAPFRLWRRKFDVVVCFQPSPFTIAMPALLLGRLKRAPVVLWVLDCWPETLEAIGVIRNRTVLRLVGAIVGCAYRRCAIVLGQSQSFGESIKRWSGQDRFRYFPNWVEAAFEDKTVTPPISPTTEPFTIVFAGNLGEAQDFPAIIEAIDALRNRPIRWVIVGEGRMEKWLRDEVVARGLLDVVTMPGRRPVEEMPSLFAQADALLVALAPKPVFAMTVPGKVQSYMAAGKPVLGMLDGEGAALIESARCGIAVPAGDHDSLVSAIERLYAMPSNERVEIGRRGQLYAKAHFDRSIILGNLDQWIQGAAAANSMSRLGV